MDAEDAREERRGVVSGGNDLRIGLLTYQPLHWLFSSNRVKGKLGRDERKTHLHDEFEGIEDDHAGLGREDSLDVGIGLGVGYAGQRPPAAAVACSTAAADGGVAAQRKRVVSG